MDQKSVLNLPVVYFEITNGNAICSGIKGTAINPSFSFGIPDSTNFSVKTLSVAENPI